MKEKRVRDLPLHRKGIPEKMHPGSVFHDSCLFRRLYRVMFLIAILLPGMAAAAGRMVLIVPRPDEFVAIDEFFVVIALTAEDKATGKVRMFFDNEEITKQTVISAATLRFMPDSSFISRNGRDAAHLLTVVRRGTDGRPDEELTARIYIVENPDLSEEQRASLVAAGAKLAPVHPREPIHTGKVVARFDYETFQDTGNPVGELDAWGNGSLGSAGYDYNLTLRTDEDKRFQTLQRFRLAINYRGMARLSAGDNWPSYHKSILDHQRIRGFELNLKTPRKFAGFDFVWGEAQRPVKPLLVSAEALAACSTHNDSSAVFVPGVYGRTLLASRLSFGSPANFSAALTALKATDKTASIDQITLIDASGGDTMLTGRTPMDNLVYGAVANLSLLKGAAQLGGSFAMSWMTKDVSGGPVTSSELERIFGAQAATFKPEKLSWLLIINETTVPLPLPADTTVPVSIRSLGGATNWDASLRLRSPFDHLRGNAEVKYFHAGPTYASLGNPLLVSDRAGWLVDADSRLFGNRLFLKGRLTWFDRDLFGISGTPMRALQGSLNGSFVPSGNLPTLTFLGSFGNERPRTIAAVDPGRRTFFSTCGGALHYSHLLGKTTPSGNLSYYTTSTEFATSALPAPFNARTHTVVAGVVTLIDGIALEPGVTASFNTTQGTAPQLLFSVAGGTRWRIIPKKLLTDVQLGFANTAHDRGGRRDELFVRGSGNWEIGARQSLRAEAGLKWTIGEVVDRRLRAWYELRY